MLRSVQLNRSLSQDLSCFPVRRYYSICARRPPLGGATRFPHRWRPRKGAASPPCRLRPRLKKPTASYFAHHNPQEHSASSCCWTCCPDEKKQAELELELGSGNARGSAKKNGVWSNYYHRVLISSSFTVRQFWGKIESLYNPNTRHTPNVSGASTDSFALVPALCSFCAENRHLNRVPQPSSLDGGVVLPPSYFDLFYRFIF